MNNYQKSLVAQSALLVLSCILVIVYTKNQMMNGFSSKAKKICLEIERIEVILNREYKGHPSTRENNN